MIGDKLADGKYSNFMLLVRTIMPWTMWIARVFNYGLLELFYWAWTPSWFGRTVQAEVYREARAQIKSEKLANEILFDKNDVSGCKRPILYKGFYR